ncbi:hypothetical protein E2562_025950 [Oryza meyeriana var. granulata]|uniref:Uncharacterized protein n=1 Tax=Oryza meyeriana var. granulata TaxID=110450 RepID=A0A6G1EYZ8_9ORYZ|nr:hypothetical protein E2562_025950 [Oryza meyeriana var. granulata]
MRAAVSAMGKTACGDGRTQATHAHETTFKYSTNLAGRLPTSIHSWGSEASSSSSIDTSSASCAAAMALEQLGRRNVAGPLLLLNLLMYVFMLGFAGWALNSSIKNAGVDVGGWGEQQPWAPYYRQSAWAAARFHLATSAALAGVLGVAAKVAAAYHGGRSGSSWKPQGLAAAASLGTAAWAVTALAFGLACREIHDAAAAGAARGWRMRALEGLTVTLAFTQLLDVLLLHAALAGERCGLACPADA